jgi:hypothetical protein
MTLAFNPDPAEPKQYLPRMRAGRSNSSHIDSGNLESAVQRVIDYVANCGFVFQPWQVAAYITAVRTKPFIILAGISGTGKTKLPRLVAEATGAKIDVIAVRPDWTDGSDLLGYHRLDDHFVPGSLLTLAKEAINNPDRQHFVLLDEMNLARVEYYLADVLSRLEDRYRDDGTIVSAPLLPFAGTTESVNWSQVYWPSNLCLVGSVNMDETTHGFSRKVLDRSFVIEFSDIDLNAVGCWQSPSPTEWSADRWKQHYLNLAEFSKPDDALMLDVVGTLNGLNEHLIAAQLQVGYRVRDEVALFCANARANDAAFTTSDGQIVDPLDLSITMKILPRIQGGGTAIRTVLDGLTRWAVGEDADDPDEQLAAEQTRAFPMCADRLALMHQRLDDNGFTSYWL